MVDGSTYQGSTTKQRNIVITAQMERDYQANRDLLYKCFKPKSTGLFTYIEGSETRVIDYKVEGIDIDEAGVVRNFSISLLCPDPFFRDLEDISVSMASWTGLFEWPHEFLEEKMCIRDRDGHDPEQQAAEEAAARKRQEIRDLTVKAIMEGE